MKRIVSLISFRFFFFRIGHLFLIPTDGSLISANGEAGNCHRRGSNIKSVHVLRSFPQNTPF